MLVYQRVPPIPGNPHSGDGRSMAVETGLGSSRDDKRHWDLQSQGHQQSQASLRKGATHTAGLFGKTVR
jgi:hypothetical protein